MYRENRVRVSLEPSFLLLLSLIFYLEDGSGIFFWILAASGIHEVGHTAAAYCFGGRIKTLVLSITGGELKFVYRYPLCYGRENMVLLAGPAVNLVLVPILYWLDLPLPSVASFGLAAFNLLPVLPMDGGRVLYNLLCEWIGPDRANLVMTILSSVVIGVMLGAGIIFVVQYANVIPFLMAVWLLIGILRQKELYVQI